MTERHEQSWIEEDFGPQMWVWDKTCKGQGCPFCDYKGGWYEEWPWNREVRPET